MLPDRTLLVHMGDGFDFTTAQNLNSYRGKVLRLNLDGSPVLRGFHQAGRTDIDTVSTWLRPLPLPEPAVCRELVGG